jgi:dynein heavy chain
MSSYRTGLQNHFDRYLAPSLSFLRKNMKEIVPTVDCQMVQSLLNIIECWLSPYYPEYEDEDPSKTQSKLPSHFELTIEYFVFFGLVWSIGASTDHEGRRKFDTYLRGVMSTGCKAEFPPEGTVYDYCYNAEKTSWAHWMSTVPEYTIRPAMSFSEITVPTIDSVRNTFLLDLLLSKVLKVKYLFR